MNAVGRMVLLDVRTVSPYHRQGLFMFALYLVLFATRPAVLVPALVLVLTPMVAAYPFNVGDKAALSTLYAVLPVPRRAVVVGHYAWALSTFVVTAGLGTAAAVIIARFEHVAFGPHLLFLVLTAAWGFFAVTVSLQFPLFIRYGYTRLSLLGTTLPMALVVGSALKFHLDLDALLDWLPMVWPAGAALIAASIAVTLLLDRRGVRG
ncbi:ABC-2 transporter permease [Dactylosporangium vinaceum]|uniref:ABC-2 transporter permease n=1 Tax=Dactylosporangium vinaceum TaxID=53362 RepID=A0ABV5M0M6_9ACTN|nr:ABC-2 transporter permease [Dactylosporangium vinaceum]UAB97415.1 ABC-2 transporter permease [Dactylosporangium vinaceum]